MPSPGPSLAPSLPAPAKAGLPPGRAMLPGAGLATCSVLRGLKARVQPALHWACTDRQTDSPLRLTDRQPPKADKRPALVRGCCRRPRPGSPSLSPRCLSSSSDQNAVGALPALPRSVSPAGLHLHGGTCTE